MRVLYILRRKHTKLPKVFGPAHGSMDKEATLCGAKADHEWVVNNNIFDREITCKDCLKKEYPTYLKSIAKGIQ